MNQNKKPIHTHDCTDCVFLGTHRGVDMYAHWTKGTAQVSLILRTGSDGPDYDSMPLFDGLYGGTAGLIAFGSYGQKYTLALYAARAWQMGVKEGAIRMTEVIAEISK